MKNTWILLVLLIMSSCQSSKIDKALETLKPKIEDNIKYQVAKWKTYKSDAEEFKTLDYDENPDALTLEEYNNYFESVTKQVNDWYENSKEIEAEFTSLKQFYRYSDIFPFVVNWAESIKESKNSWIESEIIEKIVDEYSVPLSISAYELVEDLGGDVIRYKVHEQHTGLEFIVQLNKVKDGYHDSLRLTEESLATYLK